VPRGGAGPAEAAQPGFVEARERISNCALEVEVPWQALQCLTPDATQLADTDWRPQMPPGLAGAVPDQNSLHHARRRPHGWVCRSLDWVCNPIAGRAALKQRPFGSAALKSHR